MTIEIDPPRFTSQNFERYKRELQAWSEVTNISKAKQGAVIALSLPEDDQYQIREKVFSGLSLDDLTEEDSLNILIKFLDGYLGKDELVVSIDKFEEFENFERADKQCIRDYIASFDLKYRKLEKLNIKLSPEILAFKFLRKAKLSKEMRILVMTEISFSNRREMYEDTKRSLQKFVVGIMEESVWKESVTAKYKSESFGDRFMKQTYDCGLRKLSRIGKRKDKGPCKKTNPVGAKGKTMLCNSCGSYRHLLAECPDSWENIENKYVSQKNLKSMFPCVKGGICNDDGVTRYEYKGELQVGLEMNYSVPGKLKSEIARLTIEVKCLKAELRMMKVDKDEQIKEQKQGKKWESSFQEEVVAQITRLKHDLNGVKKIQDDRQIERSVAEQKLEKETEKQWYETRVKFDSTVEELQKRISRLEKERGCIVDNKESDMVITNQKVKELNGTRQMIQEIHHSIKQERHTQSIVSQDEQKYGIVQALDDKEELQQYKMIIREILPIYDTKLLRMMYCDNQLNYGMNIQEVYQRFKMLQTDQM